MYSSLISLVINMLSAIQFMDRREDLQRQILQIVRDEIDLLLKPKKKIEEMRAIYERDGKIPAIKEWRTINTVGDTPLNLKDAKDQIEGAAVKYDWRDFRVGKRAKIHCPTSDWDNASCTINRVVPEGFYVRFSSKNHDVFFHQSAVHIEM